MAHFPDTFWVDLDELRKINRRLDDARELRKQYKQQADKFALLAEEHRLLVEQGEVEIEAVIKKLNTYFAVPESAPTGGEGTDPKAGG